ncbi:hypothetical protein [Kribbella sp. NPDC050470]|uniref:hypothetical protein n=1 Tax=unclassified Kribbella TaxID=2644121 RepID=UPI00379FB00E
MIALPHEPSGLTKATWTDADFAVMGWHDCRIHAVSIAEYDDGTLPPARVLLDVDYIVRRVDGQAFSFWIAPATLVFEGVWEIRGDFGPLHELLEIDALHGLDPPDATPDPLLHLEGHNFDLRLRSAGFTQYLRRPPQHVRRQLLTPAERGGLSFAEHSFA